MRGYLQERGQLTGIYTTGRKMSPNQKVLVACISSERERVSLVDPAYSRKLSLLCEGMIMVQSYVGFLEVNYTY